MSEVERLIAERMDAHCVTGSDEYRMSIARDIAARLATARPVERIGFIEAARRFVEGGDLRDEILVILMVEHGVGAQDASRAADRILALIERWTAKEPSAPPHK